jgi:hypothetical protein
MKGIFLSDVKVGDFIKIDVSRRGIERYLKGRVTKIINGTMPYLEVETDDQILRLYSRYFVPHIEKIGV